MALINLVGQRENTTNNSQGYKNKIIEYLKSRGYLLISDSISDGTLADLKFKDPTIDRRSEIWIEAKYTNLSIKDVDFLKELGRYFIIYGKMDETKRFYLYLFIKKCKNFNKWKIIFDELRSDADEINKLRDTISKSLESDEKEFFDKCKKSLFYTFISEITIYQAEYDNLTLNIDNVDKNKFVKLDYDKYDSLEPKDKPEIITSNVLKVTKFPEILHKTKIKQQNNLFYRYDNKIICMHYRGYLFSVLSPQMSPEISNYLDNGSESISYSDLEIIEPNFHVIVSQLIKKYVISKCLQIGMLYDEDMNVLYYEHREGDKDSRKIRHKQVSKKYKNKENEINFCTHIGFNIKVTFLSNDYYLVIEPFRIFTSDGKNLIRGNSAKSLHYKFPPKYELNNVVEKKVKSFTDSLNLDLNTLDNESYFLFSNLLSGKINRKPFEERLYGVSSNILLSEDYSFDESYSENEFNGDKVSP